MELFFGELFWLQKEVKSKGVKVTPDIEELKQPQKRSYPVPNIVVYFYRNSTFSPSKDILEGIME